VLRQKSGLTDSLINKTASTLKPVSGRLSSKKGINGATILNDSYNSNVEGFILAIKNASDIKFQKKYIVSRGVIELGKEKKSSYQRILETLNDSDLKLLTTDKDFQKLDNNKVEYFSDENSLLNYLKKILNKNSLLIIEGRFEPTTLNVLFANSQHLHKD